VDTEARPQQPPRPRPRRKPKTQQHPYIMAKKKKKSGKKGKKADPDEAEPEPEPEACGWVCPECEQENEAEDEVCIACEESRPVAAAAVDPRYAGYKVGVIESADPVAGKDKLTKLEVDIGDDEPLNIVTNAPNAKVGNRIVVAAVGAVVRTGSHAPRYSKGSQHACSAYDLI
jgi:tRNA-binding EMAP/Myf-like protein